METWRQWFYNPVYSKMLLSYYTGPRGRARVTSNSALKNAESTEINFFGVREYGSKQQVAMEPQPQSFYTQAASTFGGFK